MRRTSILRSYMLPALRNSKKHLGLTTFACAALLAAACGSSSEDDGGVDRSRPDTEPGGGQALGGADDAAGTGAQAGGGGAQAGTSAGDSSGGSPLSGAGGQPDSPARAVCGDGQLADTEACDDGANLAGDGCSEDCRLELGYGCHGQPSVCALTVCGNGVPEGLETCDDGNTVPFDGCGVACQSEPQCSSDGCTSVCGDGLVIGEQCDDGNTRSGDGCSATCKKEPGFTCEQRGTCESVNGTCVLRVPVIYRDFTAEHRDFGVACVGQEATLGLLEKKLRTDGVPVATANASQSCITRVADWYSDAATKAIVRELALFDAGQGNFVNRYGALGEQWATQPVYTARFCGNGDTGCVAGGDFVGCDFDPDLESCFYPCPAGFGPPTDSCAGTVSSPLKYEGTPLFFPLDDQPQAEPWRDAKVPAQYGYEWLWEDTVVPVYGAAHVSAKAAHNFNFTTQLVSWFRYTAAGAPSLDFSSDDDMWVFVNGKLAVDLGGVHPPAEATLTLDTTTAQNLGLTPGGVYRIDILHADRRPESSSLRVTLPWFDLSRSVCEPL